MSQVDLPRKQKSGLAFALDALEKVDGVGIVRMGQTDVLRHSLVKKMITAMDEMEAKLEAERKKFSED